MELEFKDVKLSSRKLHEKYIKPWKCENAEFSFAHIYIWGGDGKIQFAEANDCLFVKLDFDGEVPFLWPPFPKDNTVDYAEAVKTGCSYMKSIGVKLMYRSVSEPFKEMMEKFCPEINLEANRNNFDYMYLSESLSTLKGKKLHGKRNHINKILKEHPDYIYDELTSAHYEECIALYDEWCMDHKEVTITQYDERTSVERALLNLEELGLTGGCIRIGGVLKAFTVGEQVISGHMSQIHIEKAAKDIDGLYPLINQKYVQEHCIQTMYINREEDMGLEGLRKAKSSYHPAKFCEKYDGMAKCQLEIEKLQVEQELCRR